MLLEMLLLKLKVCKEATEVFFKALWIFAGYDNVIELGF